MKILKMIYHRLPLRRKVKVIYSYNGKLPIAPSLPEGLCWERASSKLLDLVMKDDENRKNSLKGLLMEGAYGVIIHNGESWVAHGFVSPPGIAMPKSVPKDLVVQSWFFFYMHTHHKWRERGLFKSCLRLLLLLICEIDGSLNNTLADVTVNNKHSREGFIKTGFKPAGLLSMIVLKLPKYKRILWWHWDENEKHPVIEE